MNDRQTTPVPPVILTPRSDEGRLEGSNGRYEKRLADLVGVYRDAAAYRAVLDADDGAPVYWVESSTTEDGPGGLITGISVLEPGRVGEEYAIIERAGGMASLVVADGDGYAVRANPDHRGYTVVDNGGHSA